MKGKTPSLLIVDDIIKEAGKTPLYDLGKEADRIIRMEMERRNMSMLKGVRLVLEKALDVIGTSEKWVKGHDAVNTRNRVMKPLISAAMKYLKESEPIPVSDMRIEMVPQPVDPRDPSANAFCSQGAVIRAIQLLCLDPRFRNDGFDRYGAEILNKTLRFVSDHIPEDYVERVHREKGISERECRNIVRFNDDPDTTYEDVRLCFKKALHSLDD